jgi:hypothetical protein
MVLSGLAAALLLMGGAVPGQAEVAPPAALSGPASASPGDGRPAWLRVDTVPAGLLVLVDGDPVGRSPIDSIPIHPGTVHVRAMRDDARRFDRERDEAVLTLRPGESSSVSFDLRPPVALESAPMGASVSAQEERGQAHPDAIGQTPLWLPPAFLGGRTIRLSLSGFADSSLAGTSLLAMAASRGTAVVALRRIEPLVPVRERGRPFFRRRWVQWGVVTLGAGLTAASALFKHEGDRWYDRYLGSSDRRVLDDYFNRAVHYDHLSLVSLGFGQAIFTGGLVLLVSGGAR